MKAKDLAKASLGVGTAALLGLASPACSSTTPQESDTSGTQTEAVQATEPAASERPAESTEPAATAQPAEGTEVADAGASESQGESKTPSKTAPGDQSEAEQEPAAQSGRDCTGKNRFTEECGYASPTRYAVLHPRRIVNS